MKKTTKILSVFMAILMVVSCIPMTAFAQSRDTSSLDAYLDTDNLAIVIDDLLTALGDRKEEIVPTVLTICFQLIDALKAQATEDGIDPMTADADALADSLINYLDVVIAEADLDSAVAEYKSLISIIGIKVNLGSVDEVLETLASALDYFAKKGVVFCGDAAKFSTKAIKVGTGNKQEVISTKNSSGLDIVYALFGFLSDSANIGVIKKVIQGNLSLGNLNNTIKPILKMDIEAEVNNAMGDNLGVMINEELYNGLLKGNSEVAYADSIYAKDKYTCDELLAAALLKAVSGTEPTKSEASEAATMTFIDIIAEYADIVMASFLVEPLNTDLKDALNKLIAMDPQLAVLKDIINMDYEFTADTFNFAEMAENGLFSNANNMVCTIAEVVLKNSVIAELGLKKGGNENINYNLTAVFGYLLKTLASNNGGKLEFTFDNVDYSFDFSGFTAANIAGKTLEDMVVAVISLFYPTLLDMELPAEVTSLEQLCGYTAYVCIDKFMVKDASINFNKDYSSLVLANGKVRDMAKEQWNDVLGNMGMDVAVYWLNDSTNFGMSVADADALKAKGWTWEDIFEDIVDWALNYIDGIPAVADELTTVRGKKDGSAWYKLNVVINEFLPMGFINDCGDETFTVDLYNTVMETIVPSLYDCNFVTFANIIDETEKNAENNPLNKPVIQSIIEMIDNLLFSIFTHECDSIDTFEKAATVTHDGYNGKYCKSNGHYIDATVIPATGVKDPVTAPTTAKPAETTAKPVPTTAKPVPTTAKPAPTTAKPAEPTTIAPAPAGELGDVDGNGKITANDARAALRISARLENVSAAVEKLADIDGNGKVTAADARKILRFSAKLDKELA